MTDTTLPEEIEDAIAEVVRAAYLLPDGIGLDSLDDLMDNTRLAIAIALRQARAEALEEAAEQADRYVAGLYGSVQEAGLSIARIIRALKETP